MSGQIQQHSNEELELWAAQARHFAQLFHFAFDYQRGECGKFYQAHSVLLWEGTSLTGAKVAQFLDTLPPSRRTVASVNAHALGDLSTSGVPPTSPLGPSKGDGPAHTTLSVTVTG
ncbi:MAG: hypothetical protein MHM6MM_003678, partial [Cercozoa sp. M6MM]